MQSEERDCVFEKPKEVCIDHYKLRKWNQDELYYLDSDSIYLRVTRSCRKITQNQYYPFTVLENIYKRASLNCHDGFLQKYFLNVSP